MVGSCVNGCRDERDANVSRARPLMNVLMLLGNRPGRPVQMPVENHILPGIVIGSLRRRIIPAHHQ